MTSQEIPARWDQRLIGDPFPQFLQSSAWAAFQSSLSRELFFIHDEEFSYQGMGVRLPLGRAGSYLFFPRGPYVRDGEAFARFCDEATALCRKKNFLFFRCEPIGTSDVQIPKTLKKTTAIHPADTLCVDLSKSEEELFYSLHQKTRYNIRLAQKKGVRVSDELSEGRIEDFLRLLRKTSERQPFSTHPAEYYRALIRFFSTPAPQRPIGIRLYSAIHHDICIANICVLEFGPIAVYLHGASDYAARDLMAPALLQWEAMLSAKRRGCQTYDFWGITPSADPHHPWAGITRFKKGFGGTVVSYPGTFDSACSPLYQVYAFARRVLKGR